MLRFFASILLFITLWGCVSTSPQVAPSPTVYTPGAFPTGEDKSGQHAEEEGKKECESVSAEAIRTGLLAGINQLRRQGCDCMGVTMPKVRALKWSDSFEGYAIGHSKRTISGEIAYQPIPSYDITNYHYESLFSFQNEGAVDVARLLIAIQLQSKQCQAIMNKDFKMVGASKQGCYWTVVLQ